MGACAPWLRDATIAKSNVLAPPDLLAPLNFSPLIEPDPKQASVHFEWTQVPDATELHCARELRFNF